MKFVLGIVAVLIATGIVAAFSSAIKVELLDQRETMHYKKVLELKNDIKGIKKYLYTGEKKYLIENEH